MRGTSSDIQYEARIVTNVCEVLYLTAVEVAETCPKRGATTLRRMHLTRCR